jgi:hypothetical protein
VSLGLKFCFERSKKIQSGLSVCMDNYWLAISMAKVEDIAVLPKIFKPITTDELKSFFSEKAK